jgi:hypothetical protein
MVRNILAIVIGWIGGSAINFGLIMANMALLPAGTDFSTPEGIAAAIPNFQPINFAIVFFAHALGTLVGAFAATLIAIKNKFLLAMSIGVLFFIGGIWAAVTIPAPVWFIALDLIVAYIPMAWLGWKIASGSRT